MSKMASEYGGSGYSKESGPEHNSRSNYIANGCPDCAGRGLCRKHDIRATKNFATPGGISISPELFEKMFLAPQDSGKSALAERVGNPTPVGLLGIMLSLTPLACDLMGWRGSGGDGMAAVGAYLFFGGLLLIIGGVLEWIVGQTLNYVVFMAYGAFWLTIFAILEPSFMSAGIYAPTGTPTTDPVASTLAGASTPSYNASLGFFMLFMALLNVVFLICSIRTDIVHVIIFITLVVAFSTLTGYHFNLALGYNDLASQLQVASGVSLFITSMGVWYSFLAVMIEIMEFPFRIPCGDLTHMFKDTNARSHV